MMKFWIVFIFFVITLNLDAKDLEDLRVLHLSFHKGCISEIDQVAELLGFKVETMFVPALEPKEFDGVSSGNCLYNIGEKRARDVWEKNSDYFGSFDAIITSDTVPLSRIFLQNEWKKPLIIWMCNRFDYSDRASLDCDFPDAKYYNLLNKAVESNNVYFVAYSLFEHEYAKMKGVNTGDLVIKPCSPLIKKGEFISIIPENINKSETFFLPPYHNETNFMDLHNFCKKNDISTYCGRYNGPLDLIDFKGIIHLPYAWSNLALFENMKNELVSFIPSKKFFMELVQNPNYFIPDKNYILNYGMVDFVEWYVPEHRDVFVYFDSWEDLLIKLKTTDLQERKENLLRFSFLHQETTLKKWLQIFENVAQKTE